MILFLLGGLFIGGAVVAFALQNTTMVTAALFAWRVESSLALIIMLAIASGAIISLLWLFPGILKRNLQILNLKRRVSKLEDELANNKKKTEIEITKVATDSIDYKS